MVATGECASKFWMGSALPLVEIRLRMGPRSTVVVRTFKGPGLVKKGITATAANNGSAHQIRRLGVAGRPFELLLVPANRLSFSVRPGCRQRLQALIYHSDGALENVVCASRCVVRCWPGAADA